MSDDDDDDRRRSSTAPGAKVDLEDGAPAKPPKGGVMAPWLLVEYRTLLRLVIVSTDCGCGCGRLRALSPPSLRAVSARRAVRAVSVRRSRRLCAPSLRALSALALSPRALSTRPLSARPLSARFLSAARSPPPRAACVFHTPHMSGLFGQCVRVLCACVSGARVSAGASG